MPRTESPKERTMKISLISLAAVAAILAGVFGTGQALATTKHQSRPKTLQIVMRDPGCHWCKGGGKYPAQGQGPGWVSPPQLRRARPEGGLPPLDPPHRSRQD